MEGTERAQPFILVLTGLFSRLVGGFEKEGTERAQPVHICLNIIVYQSCRAIWTWKGLSEPSLFTFVLTELFTSIVVFVEHGRD